MTPTPKPESKWERGVNVTVSPLAHAKLKELAQTDRKIKRRNIRAYVDRLLGIA